MRMSNNEMGRQWFIGCIWAYIWDNSVRIEGGNIHNIMYGDPFNKFYQGIKFFGWGRFYKQQLTTSFCYKISSVCIKDDIDTTNRPFAFYDKPHHHFKTIYIGLKRFLLIILIKALWYWLIRSFFCHVFSEWKEFWDYKWKK